MKIQGKEYIIEHLKPEEWKGHLLPIEYEAKAYYEVESNQLEDGFMVRMTKKAFDQPVVHTQAMCHYADKLYQEFLSRPCAWGMIHEGKLIAAIETDLEAWSNRLRVTELWVDQAYRRQGIGHALMAVAKEEARIERRRAIILETQSCNTEAIAFYLKEGFKLIGFDSCAYHNDDIQRKEVRMAFGYTLRRKEKLTREQIEIREIKDEDWHELEEVTQHAFWNKYRTGCNEHYLVHQLRYDKDYVPECSLVAIKNDKIIGAILYARSKVVEDKVTHEVITFGPLCVHPEWQGTRVGEHLLQESIVIAKQMGYAGIIIFGEPDYYPRLGFKTCDHFGITTPEGENFDAFMGYALDEKAFSHIRGKFYEAPVMSDQPEDQVEAFNKEFPPLEKQYFPMQWHD